MSIVELYEKSGRAIIIDPITTALVDIACTSTCLSRKHFTEQSLKISPLPSLGFRTPRDIMIEIGKELRATQGELALCHIHQAKHAQSGSFVVVPDIRRDVEANWVRQNNGVLYHVVRFVPMTRHQFLESIGIEDVDSYTESPIERASGDTLVSLIVKSGVTKIIYENLMVEAA
ncbi:MAG: hypothetical protein QM504_06800 [Pseudomonadota bacterium]